MALEMNDLMALSSLDKNQMSPYEQYKIGYLQQKNHTSGIGVAGLVLGTVGTAAAVGAWIFGPMYGNAKANQAKEVANSAKELANVQIAASQRQLDQLTNLLASERSERYRDSAPNKPYYKYMMAKRFVRCNFGTLDSTMYDIEAGRMNFERIECPIRGECKYDGKICSPLFNAHMTLQEQRVAKLWYEGAEKDEIAGVLFISPETVNNHIRNIYHKLNVHDKGEFVRYIDAHSVFGHSSHSL